MSPLQQGGHSRTRKLRGVPKLSHSPWGKTGSCWTATGNYSVCCVCPRRMATLTGCNSVRQQLLDHCPCVHLSCPAIVHVVLPCSYLQPWHSSVLLLAANLAGFNLRCCFQCWGYDIELLNGLRFEASDGVRNMVFVCIKCTTAFASWPFHHSLLKGNESSACVTP